MINLDNVDRPAILAEVTAAFYQYEEALVSNNIEALDALFLARSAHRAAGGR